MGQNQVAASGKGTASIECNPVKAASLSSAELQQQLMEEATKVLRSFRLAALSIEGEDSGPKISEVYPRRAKAPSGLLDGGATHALRTARAGEVQNASHHGVAGIW